MISALSREIAGIKTSVCAKPHSEGSYQSALLSNLPVARTEPKRIEEVAESTTHELVNPIAGLTLKRKPRMSHRWREGSGKLQRCEGGYGG
ncbi:Hypothetical predicted protein [Octopus vulgaris]|uniref:Uncharacterized protein n=1 Tax=Octopus vulgaris TaxID=6645 RepID=A0AA36BKQ1_OCTVU|nr:Hypothetical predicted protein [Octopus vulgaris]